jgi:hypothetical protein
MSLLLLLLYEGLNAAVIFLCSGFTEALLSSSSSSSSSLRGGGARDGRQGGASLASTAGLVLCGAHTRTLHCVQRISWLIKMQQQQQQQLRYHQATYSVIARALRVL